MHIHHKINSQLAGLQLCAYCIHIICPVFKVSEWQLIQMGASLRCIPLMEGYSKIIY